MGIGEQFKGDTSSNQASPELAPTQATAVLSPSPICKATLICTPPPPQEKILQTIMALGPTNVRAHRKKYVGATNASNCLRITA